MNREILPQGAEAGASGVYYRVWAPVCERVDVEIYKAGVLRTVPLSRQRDGYFDGCDEAGSTGDRYKFRLNGEQSFPDPASRWQPEGVHGPSMVIDPRAFKWADSNWKCGPVRDFVIYEMHVGTFTPAGTFRSAIERIPYLRDLGVNAVELMPIGDFPGTRNWGYDGVCLYAPSRAYGHPDDLRAFVDAAHATGLAVILDVIYNHFGPDGNYLGAYIGDYLDESKKTPWGGAIRYGSPDFKPLRTLVVSNPGYWMREFHIDGFRLDATHAIIDESPRHILQELTSAVHAQGGFAMAEDARNDARLLLPEDEGGYGFDGIWADDFHHIVRVANTHENESYLADFQGTPDELIDALRHGWLYRGQPSRRKGSRRGTECRHIAPEKFIHCISNHDQVGNRALGDRFGHAISAEAYRAASVLLCLSPYLPLLFMGQEWEASTPFLFFTDHHGELGKLITLGRREEFKDFKAFTAFETLEQIPDPQSKETFEKSKLNWNELADAQHAQIFELYKACLSLRNAEPAFRPVSRDAIQIEALAQGIGVLRMKANRGDWLLLFDLVGGHHASFAEEWLCRPGEKKEWRASLSSNETRFGGAGGKSVDLAHRKVTFRVPEVVVLREAATGAGVAVS